MKIGDTILFLNNPLFHQPLPFYGRNLTHSPFSNISKTQSPPPRPLQRWQWWWWVGGPNLVISIRNESFTEYSKEFEFKRIQKKLQELFTSKLTSFNLKMAFMSHIRVKRFFTFKSSYLTCYI